MDVEGEEQTRAWGRRLGEQVAPGDFIALVGPVGAGKSVFARGVLEGLGAEPDRGSPTFTIIHEYQGRLRAVHADLYRLGTRAAQEDLGLDELFAGEAVCLVEWAEQAPELWPDEHLEVRIERPVTGSPTRRRLAFRARGRRAVALLQALAGAVAGGC